MSRQPVSPDSDGNSCVQSRPATNQDPQDWKPSLAGDTPLGEPSYAIDPSELARLRTFFELLSQWDQSPKSE
jgi:hypothetical protein